MLFNIDKKPKESIAIIDDSGISLTYGEISDFIDNFKERIDERELVFCLCENKASSLSGFLALYDNRDVCLLLSSHIDSDLLNTLISIYQPSYMWLPTTHRLKDNYEPQFTWLNYSLCRTGFPAPVIHKDLSLLMSTSGTTGSPKLVRHKYGNIESNAKNVATAFEWTADEKGIIDLPMHYTMGLNVICSHLYVGATVLLVRSNLLSPQYWDFIKKEEGTNFTGVPYSYEILSKLRFPKMNLPFLKTLAEGGGKMTDQLFSSFAQYAQNNNKRFFATFGTTETTARLAYLPSKDAVSHIGSIGKAIPEGKLTLIDDNGAEIIGQDLEGELKYEGPNVTMGYGTCVEDLLKGDEFHGVYYTGDIARRDKDGYYYIVGRKKRFLKLYGLRISLDQTERIIKEAFDTDCVCSGDDSQMRIYITNDHIQDNVQKLIAIKTGLVSKSFKVIVINRIPRFESGKVNYRELEGC